jgi:hypothetical protein
VASRSVAQCHSHKYDPISQREYYQMAFLNNADEPEFAVPDANIAKRRVEIEQKIAKLLAELPGRFPGGREVLDRKFADWDQRESAKAVKWQMLRPAAMRSNMAHLEVQAADASVLVSGDQTKSDTYTFLKRSIPYAMFSTFDGAAGETCLARRDSSNTPLQALTMLNDLVVVEAAQALGRSIAESPGSVEERMTLLFRRCLVRPPTKDERQALIAFYERQSDRLKTGKLNGPTIAGGPNGDVGQRAAWTLVARVLLNLDEMITKE